MGKNIQSWNRIEILDQETLGSPTTLEIVRTIYQWFEDHGCKYTAIVSGTSLLKNIIESTFPNNIVFFEKVEQAERWIEEIDKGN